MSIKIYPKHVIRTCQNYRNKAVNSSRGWYFKSGRYKCKKCLMFKAKIYATAIKYLMCKM